VYSEKHCTFPAGVRSRVFVGDVSDPEKPKLLKEITTKGNPGLVIENPKYLSIPDGYDGLLIIKNDFP